MGREINPVVGESSMNRRRKHNLTANVRYYAGMRDSAGLTYLVLFERLHAPQDSKDAPQLSEKCGYLHNYESLALRADA